MALMVAAALAAAWLLALVYASRLARRGAWRRSAPYDIAALGAVVWLNVVFFWRLVLGLGWMPEGGGDNAGFLLPLYQFAQSALRSGELPLWNPHQYLGAPFAADVQTGLFYPLNVAVFLLAPRLTYEWMELGGAWHYVVAGVGMYALLRLHRTAPARVRPLPALVGAVAFMWSDVFVVHFGNLNLVATAAWLPWVLLGLIRALSARDAWRAAPWIVGAALCLGLAGLAGHPQPLLYALLVMVLYAAARSAAHLLQRPIENRSIELRSIVTYWLRTGWITVLGLGLAAVSLVPAMELVEHTRRAALSVAEAAQYALQPELLVGLVAPGVWGRGMQDYLGPWARVETGYIGLSVLLLAVLAVVLRVRGPVVMRRSPVWFCLALALLAWALALGEHTPLYGAVYERVPGLSGMRAPARFVLVGDLCLAMLAGLGLDALLRARRAKTSAAVVVALLAGLVVAVALAIPGLAAARELLSDSALPSGIDATRAAVLLAAVVSVLMSILLLGFVHGVVTRRVLGWGVATIVVVELLFAGSSIDWIDWDPVANHDPKAMAFLQGDPGVFRVEVRPEVWGWWSPSANLVHGVDDVAGVYNPLRLADTQLLWESLTDREMPLYDALNAKYLVGPKDFALPWDRFAPVHDADPNVNVYLNLRALPRAMFVVDAIEVAGHDEAWEAIHDATFDPSRQVVVETGIQGASGGAIEGDGAERPPRVDITGYRANALTVTVTTDEPGYLVVSDAYYPGWVARSGALDLPIQRANYAFKAVALTRGEHVVEFKFVPRSFYIALFISVASAVALVAISVGLLWRRHGSRESSRSAGA